MEQGELKARQHASWLNQLQRRLEICLLELNQGQLPANLPKPLYENLVSLKHDAVTIREQGLTDEQVIVFVQEQYELLRLMHDLYTQADGRCRFTGIDVTAFKATADNAQ